MFFRSSVRSAVGLLRGVALLHVPVAVLLVPVIMLLVPVPVLRDGVVLLLIRVVAHLPRIALLPKAAAAGPPFPMAFSNSE